MEKSTQWAIEELTSLQELRSRSYRDCTLIDPENNAMILTIDQCARVAAAAHDVLQELAHKRGEHPSRLVVKIPRVWIPEHLSSESMQERRRAFTRLSDAVTNTTTRGHAPRFQILLYEGGVVTLEFTWPEDPDLQIYELNLSRNT